MTGGSLRKSAWKELQPLVRALKMDPISGLAHAFTARELAQDNKRLRTALKRIRSLLKPVDNAANVETVGIAREVALVALEDDGMTTEDRALRVMRPRRER